MKIEFSKKAKLKIAEVVEGMVAERRVLRIAFTVELQDESVFKYDSKNQAGPGGDKTLGSFGFVLGDTPKEFIYNLREAANVMEEYWGKIDGN